ncbi:hypothetical protein OQA88_8448 [Cercophora sp. LCS_1]
MNNQRIRHNGPMGNAQTYGESPASGPAPTTAGHHKHDVLNKLDPRIDSTQDKRPMPQGTGGNNIPAGTYGPHSSRMANILDPRVDSDMSSQQHRGAPGAAGSAMHGGAAGNAPEGTYGPHRSRVANAMDPRVDSDMDGRGVGTQGYGAGAQGYGGGAAGYAGATASGAAAPGYGPGFGAGANHVGRGGAGNVAQPGMAGTTHTAGPHKSGLMNKLDPRVDSKTGMVKEGAYTERRGI